MSFEVDKTAGSHPGISIIVPVYKVEQYLGKCLDSVLNQTFQDFELICVNDCSPDGSRAILDDYVKRDTRIRIVDRKENGGLSAARNSGAAVATGKYLYFLDSDDWLDLDAMECCFRLAEENDLDEVIFGLQPEYESEDLERLEERYLERYSIDGVQPGKALFSTRISKRVYLACAWMRFVKHSFYKGNNLGFYPGIIHEDELYSFQCDLLADRAMYLDRPFYHYRIRKNSIMTKETFVRRFHGFGIVYMEALDFLARHPNLVTDIPEAIRHVQDGWLYSSRKCAGKVSADDMAKCLAAEPRLVPFMEIRCQYDRWNRDVEKEHEKLESIRNSRSYKLGRFLSRILTFWVPKGVHSRVQSTHL